MADEPRIQTFEEFWPFYVKQHTKKGTRMLHFAGTTAGMAIAATAVILRKPLLLIAAPIVGYAGSWAGHFFVEKNVPATFTYPLWSFRADFIMWQKMVAGTMDAEVERILAEDEDASSPDVEAGAPASEAIN